MGSGPSANESLDAIQCQAWVGTGRELQCCNFYRSLQIDLVWYSEAISIKNVTITSLILLG